jgi:hypothetical protein
LKQTWRGIITSAKTLGSNPPEKEISQMINELKSKEVSIDYELQQIANPDGHLFMEEVKRLSRELKDVSREGKEASKQTDSVSK